MLLTSHEEIQRSGMLKVVGFGEIRVKPDAAWVHLCITTRGATAEQALAENRAQVAHVLAAIQALGITREALQRGEPEPFPLARRGLARTGAAEATPAGYGAESYVTALADVEQAARILAEGIRAGGSTTSSISFGLRDERPVRRLALDVAVKSAYTEAQLIAEAAGMRLSGPHSLDVARGGDPLITICPNEASHGGDPAIAPASLTLSAQVTVDYTYLFDGREPPRRRRLNA